MQSGGRSRQSTVAHAPDQHRHVRPLAAAIGMQLVENDEIETLGILDDGPVERVLPRHQELEHHEIRQQDIGLRLPDALAFLLAFLPGVARKGRPQVFRQA